MVVVVRFIVAVMMTATAVIDLSKKRVMNSPSSSKSRCWIKLRLMQRFQPKCPPRKNEFAERRVLQ